MPRTGSVQPNIQHRPPPAPGVRNEDAGSRVVDCGEEDGVDAVATAPATEARAVLLEVWRPFSSCGRDAPLLHPDGEQAARKLPLKLRRILWWRAQGRRLGYRREPGLVSLPCLLPPPRCDLGSLSCAPGEG
jgi:hypothetical protein